MGRLRRSRWTPTFFARCPKWQRGVRKVTVEIDLQSLSYRELDFLFAIFASNGGVVFTVRCSGSKLTRWLASVDRRSVGAAERYERRLRAHFTRYKHTFREGYSLPEPPTTQLRVLYDSAAKSERRPRSPCGLTLNYGFSGGEYQWREWPLSNVAAE